MPVKIVISGATGRMGQTLLKLTKDSSEFEIVGGIDRESLDPGDALQFGFNRIEDAENAGELIAAANVLIDFSTPEGLEHLLSLRGGELQDKALVVGTTGLNNDILRRLATISHVAPIIVSANFSVGVNLMLELAESAARVLSAEGYDIEIIETHHKHKADAPSGTALMLGRVIAQGRVTSLELQRKDGRSGQSAGRVTGEIGFHSVRGGEVIGEHRVQYLGAHERLEISHAASDRGLFGEGALLAAKWLVGKEPGSYSMKEVLGL